MKMRLIVWAGVAALTAAGLIDTLKGPGPFTVFAPTDAAFAKIPKADLDALLKDQGKLKAQGRYVLEGRYGERPVGVHKSFFASGTTEREETFDAKGNMSRQKVWDESGKLVSDDEVFEDGSRKAYSK